MLTFALIIAGIISVLLMLVVLIQNPKGGGLASNFSAGNQIFGAGKTSDLVEKLTWGFAIAIIVITLYTSSFNAVYTDSSESSEGQTNIEKILENQAPVTLPQAPLPDATDGNEPPTGTPNPESVEGAAPNTDVSEDN